MTDKMDSLPGHVQSMPFPEKQATQIASGLTMINSDFVFRCFRCKYWAMPQFLSIIKTSFKLGALLNSGTQQRPLRLRQASKTTICVIVELRLANGGGAIIGFIETDTRSFDPKP